MPLQGISSLAPDDIQIVHVPGVFLFDGSDYPGFAQERIILTGDFPSFLIPPVQMLELHSQDGGLHLIQPAVDSNKNMLVFSRLAIIPQSPELLCQLTVACHHHAAVAVGAEIFRRIKAKTPQIANAPNAFASILRAMSLTGIFYHKKVMLSGDLHDLLHVSRMAVKVHGDNSPCSLCDLILYLSRIDTARIRVNIDKNRPGAVSDDTIDCRDICV